MKLMMRLAISHMKMNIVRTFVTVFALVVSVSMLTAILSFVESAMQLFNGLLDLEFTTRNLLLSFFNWFAFILCLVVFIDTTFVIYYSFALSLSERLKQYGLLKSVGATKYQIIETVLYEGFILSAISIPLGLFIGYILQYFVLNVANAFLWEISQLNQGSIQFKAVFTMQTTVISTIFSFLITLVASYLPAKHAANISPVNAINQIDNSPIKLNSLKITGLWGKLFGFEGAYSVRIMKLNRKKYRGTLILLIISVVLIIGSAGFKNIIGKDPNRLYTNYGLNTILQFEGQETMAKELNKEVNAISEAEISFIKTIPTTVIFSEKNILVNVISVDDSTYEEIIEDIGLTFSDVENKVPNGILFNSDYMFIEGERKDFEPSNITFPAILELKRDEISQKISVVGQIQKLPNPILFVTENADMNILVSEITFANFMPNEKRLYIWAINAANPKQFANACYKIFKDKCSTNDFSIFDSNKINRMNRNVQGVITILVYGFTGMTMLVALSSVISTIFTSVIYRRNEIGILYSIGMTKESIKKSLYLESLLMGLKAATVGIPFGFILCFIINKIINIVFMVNFRFPLISSLIATIWACGVPIIIIHYASREIYKKSIVETLGENY